MSNERVIEDFLTEDYSQTALYSSFRSIANYIDGLKPSSRKVIYTLKKRNITNPIKVSRFAADVSSETEYLHGEASLQSVIVNLAQNFTGSNNENLLQPEGSFGTRFTPVAAAPRYIFTRKSDNFDQYFRDIDDAILAEQYFEGSKIEPQFFAPTLPLLLINGSEGIGTGFAQKVLPRKKEELKLYIKHKLSSDQKMIGLTPHYRGFKGKVYQDESAWVFQGIFEKKNSTTIEITELPIGYTLSSYNKVLDSLVEKKVIKDYEDLCEDDQFLFRLDVKREFTAQSDSAILQVLKLEKRVTENLTCVDENNSIREFDSVEEIMDSFIKIRLEYYQKRKDYLLSLYREEIDLLDSRAAFIKAVIEGTVVVSNKPKKDIEKQIDEKLSVIKEEGDRYGYLLKMPIYSLTKEKYEELRSKISTKKLMMKELKKKTNKDLWLDDLEGVTK